MSQSLKCLQCSSTFPGPAVVSGAPVACPNCGTTRVVAEKGGATPAAPSAPIKPQLTDDDVLSFLGPPPKR